MAIALSWSRVSDYQQCARKFYLKYIAKQFPQEDASKSVHLVKGAEMHKQLENYVYDKLNGKVMDKPMSPACKDTLPIIDRVAENFGQIWPERQLAVNAQWKQVEWFAPDVAWRAILDFSAKNGRKSIVIDWKTGKVQDYGVEEPGQLHLSAAMVMDVDDVDEVSIFYAFIEHKVKKPDGGLKLTRDDYPHIRSFFTKILETVNTDTQWKPEVNAFCNYCPATKTQCQFSRKMN